ncbi:hypothetical protein [Pseudomonas sp. NCCP-436]|uniref:hypothetical protein n=1 Tax=Pseudomonas sp. NCCP-436 TaxID=2842481 RepID=UPI001C800B81|nr:hypothetical protein [Pseudomonas sp. NCCP-436]GIZ13772.1 hypothetical protein NCCP436_31880 [Pseudomonas sp. NCCP-436]
MTLQFLAGWLLGICALAVSGSLTAAQPDPLDAIAAVPAQNYLSPLHDYQAQVDEPLQDWRAANDLVGRIGGWRTYSMEGWQQSGEQADEPAAGGGHVHH